MPLFTPYFSLDSSAFRVGNGGRLRCRMGASGIGIYVMLLSHLRDCRDCRAPLDYDMLAFDLHEDAAAVRRVVEDFGLFDIDRSSGTFTSPVLTTVRGLLSDDGAAAGVGTTRTVRQRRVRSAGETYRRAVRRLAEDNALPPAEEEAPAEGDAEPAEEVPTSSENEITSAEGEHPFAEGEHQPAEEANATGNFAPTSIAAEDEPAEVKHESADAEGTPAEVEDQPAEEANATGDFADAHSPRTEEKRKEQNKKPHTPIVPFPQSGKGTRASHPAAAVVGEREEGAASAEGDEESVLGSPRFVSSAAARADAPPCAASPTVLGAPAQTLDPHPSPDTANGRTSVPNGTTSMPNSQSNALTASEAPAHPQTDTAKADTSMPNAQANTENGQTSAENGTTSMPNSQSNTLTASEAPAHPQTDTAKSDTSMPNSQADTENKKTSAANGQKSTEKTETSVPNPQPNTLTTSEKDNEAGRGEEGAGEPFVPPTANEVRRFAEALRHPEFDAEWFVAYYTERHWRRHNGRPVVSWQTTARYWLDHPLRVARHLLDHRPAASPVSVGVGDPSAVVVPAAGTPAAKPVGTSTYPAAGSASSTSPGTYPAGMGSLSPRSSASPTSPGTYPVGTGAPHVGSLSLPAPTPLQQSRLSDLKGMVLHLFADAPAAAPASASTAPDVPAAEADVPHAAADVPANASTPDWVARNSVRPACVLSPAEAAQVIAQQTLASAEAEAAPRVVHDSTADTEEIIDTQASPTNAAEASVRACDNSTADAAKDIDAMPFSTTDAEEDARNGHDSTTDAAKGFETQALSPADAEESVRACDDSTNDAEEGARNGHDSTTDAAKGIDTQALSLAHAEESVRACDDSTTDTAKDIDAQVISPADAEEYILSCDDWTMDDEEEIDAQAFSTTDAAGSLGVRAFSTDKGRWGVRSPRGPDPPTDDEHDSNAIRHAGNDTDNDFANAENHFTAQPSNFSADRHPPAAVGTARAADECRSLRTLTEKHPYLNPSFHEPHPLLRLHPPSIGGFGRTFRIQSAQPPFGRSFLGRFVDIRPACTVGSRPLRPRLTLCRTERRRCRLEHPDREHHRSADTCERSANAIRPPADEPKHGIDGRKRHDPAPEHPAYTAEHGTDERKNADFIDADPVRGHKTERNDPEHPVDRRKRHDPAPEHTVYAVEHDAQRAKNADFIDADPARGHPTECNAAEHTANADEHTADERKRHDPAPEHPTYDPDAGQRLLDTAAHRRAVRAEREACCGALRHLAHCCVAF